MKKILCIIISILMIANFGFANDSFDETKNFQGNNAKAYEGEILVVLPLVKPCGPNYAFFFDYDLFDDDWNCENDMLYYHLDLEYDKYGTPQKYLVKKNFKVFYVRPLQDYTNTWVFHMVNVIDPSDKCKFIYNGSKNYREDWQQTFPMMTQKYVEYIYRTLYKQYIYVSNVKQSWSDHHSPYQSYKALCRSDINGNPINYTKPYARYKVIDIDIDEKYADVILTLTDGKVTTKEIYTKRFRPHGDGIYMTDAKIFSEAEWNDMVAKHGLKCMEAIMAGEIYEGMTYYECVLSHGEPLQHKKTRLEYIWKFNKQYRTYKFNTDSIVIANITEPDDTVSIRYALETAKEGVQIIIEDNLPKNKVQNKVKSKVNNFVEKIKELF